MYNHGSSSFGNRSNYFSSIYNTKSLTFMNTQFLKSDKKSLAYTYNHNFINNTNSYRGSVGITSNASRSSKNRV